MLSRLAVILACVSVFAVAACGDDDAPQPKGDAVTDEEYLKVFCTGIVNYQDALLTSKDVAGIAKAVDDYVATLEPIRPPTDLETFHAAYVGYLKAALKGKDPTVLVTQKPPVPDDGPRDRLARKADNVAECKYPTFLNPPAD